MWTLYSPIDSIQKLLLNKFAEDLMKSLKKEKPFTGAPVTGTLKIFMRTLLFAKGSICTNPYVVKFNTICFNDRR